MTDENELNQLSHSNQYQVVSSGEGERRSVYRMEDGKKWRQYLAAVLCKWNLKELISDDNKSEDKIILTNKNIPIFCRIKSRMLHNKWLSGYWDEGNLFLINYDQRKMTKRQI